MLLNSWRFIGSMTWQGSTKNSLPKVLTRPLISKLIRIECRCPGIPARWRRAGYLRQVTGFRIGDFETFSEVVPINTIKLIPLPVTYPTYYLGFLPVPYLNSLRVRVWEYNGALPDEFLANELVFMK